MKENNRMGGIQAINCHWGGTSLICIQMIFPSGGLPFILTTPVETPIGLLDLGILQPEKHFTILTPIQSTEMVDLF